MTVKRADPWPRTEGELREALTCPVGHLAKAERRVLPCDAGQHCAGGDCVSDCEDASCPGGGECVDGTCMAPSTGQGGASAGGEGSVGPGEDPGVHFGGEGPDPGTSLGGAPSGEDPGGNGDDKNAVEVESGCACRAPAHGSSGAGFLVLAGLGLLAARRRRHSQ